MNVDDIKVHTTILNAMLVDSSQELERELLRQILLSIHDSFVPVRGKPDVYDSRITNMFYIRSIDHPDKSFLYIPEDRMLIPSTGMKQRCIEPLLSTHYIDDFKEFLEWGMNDYDVRKLIQTELWAGQWNHIEAWDSKFNTRVK